MNTIDITSQTKLTRPNEMVTFFVIMIIIGAVLIGSYYYDLSHPFFSDAASRFYNWLIN